MIPFTQNGSKEYFSKHYEEIARYPFVSDSKVILHDHKKGDPRYCRFCHRNEDEVEFKSVAHAVPESLGNHTIISLNECDECNACFGSTYEDQLGKWSAWYRSVWGVEGKKRMPTFVSNDSRFRISQKTGNFDIEINDAGLFEDVLKQEEDPVRIVADLPTIHTPPYIPVQVALALLKIACSICPTEELAQCRIAIDWLMKPVNFNVKPFPVLICRLPETIAAAPGEVIMLRRTTNSPQPYLWVVLRMGDRQLQWFIPGCSADNAWQHSGVKTPLLFRFYQDQNDTAVEAAECYWEDWSHAEPVRKRIDGRIELQGQRLDRHET